jgi:hypothetical protein
VGVFLTPSLADAPVKAHAVVAVPGSMAAYAHRLMDCCASSTGGVRSHRRFVARWRRGWDWLSPTGSATPRGPGPAPTPFDDPARAHRMRADPDCARSCRTFATLNTPRHETACADTSRPRAVTRRGRSVGKPVRQSHHGGLSGFDCLRQDAGAVQQQADGVPDVLGDEIGVLGSPGGGRPARWGSPV